MRSAAILIAAALIALIALVNPVQAARQNKPEALARMLARLQKNPRDEALREKIIKLALELKPPVPKTAYVYIDAAKAFAAQSRWDYSIGDYQRALVLAPWAAEYYKALSDAQEKAGEYEDAIASLRLFLLATPRPDSATQEKTWEEIGALKAEETRPPAVAPQQASPPQQAEQAEPDRQTLPARANAIVNYLNGLYQGKIFDTSLECNSAPKRNTFYHGCTWAEFQGNNWYEVTTGAFNVEFSASPDGKTVTMDWSESGYTHTYMRLQTPDYPPQLSAEGLAPLSWSGTGPAGYHHLWFLNNVIVWTDAPVLSTDKSFNPAARYKYVEDTL